MTGLDWNLLEPLLEELLDLPPEDHADFIVRSCGGDLRFEKKLRDLVASERDTSFLRPIPKIPGGMGEGDFVGPYRLVELLGQGGMGEVWLGERNDGAYDKRVAIKLIQRGMATDDLMRRFEIERQVLAWLEHPGIARLLDGGVREDGRPFFVMEFVDGVPIDRFCREANLPIADRIELFLVVSDAVQHAHERGVVHRDLKPDNVLVDRAGTPRLLDFGIAKVLGVEDERETIEMTRTGQRLYSPQYASPEQVRGDATGATSDVYSLGVLLCEVLTGSRPYDARTTSQIDLERLICETRPARPSDLVQEKATRNILRGDLDWVVATALRKEPERRFASAKALSEDLRRHLAGERVLARPDSAIYRMGLFTRKNRAVVGGLAALMLGLVASLVLWRVSAETARESRWVAYASVLQAAESAIRDGHIHVASARLMGTPPDLRGWEWRHLQSRLDHSEGEYPQDWQPNQVQGLALSPDGGLLAVRELAALDIRDSRSGRLVSRRSLHSKGEVGDGPTWMTSVQFHPNGDSLAATLRDGTLCVLRADTLETIEQVRVGEAHLHCAVYDPTGRWLACGLQTGEVVVYGLPGLGEVARWVAHDEGQMQLSFNGSGSRLLSCSWDEHARIWSVPGFELERDLTGHSRWVRGASFAAGDEQVVTVSLDGTARIWPVEGDEPPLVFRSHSGSVSSLAISADGEEAFTGGDDGQILCWRVRDAVPLATLIGHRGFVDSLIADENGRVFSASSTDGTVRSWRPGTDDVTVLEGCEYQRSIALNSDRKEISVGQPGGQVQRWSLFDLQPLESIPSKGSHVLEVEYSPDGDHLYACTHDGWIRSWRLPGLALETERHAQLGEIGRASFDEECEWAVTCSREPSGGLAVHLFDLTDPAPLDLSNPLLLESSTFQMTGGGLILAGGDGGEVWRVAAGSRARELVLRTKPVTCLSVDSAGGRMLIGHQSGAALWKSGARQWLTEGVGETVISAAFHPTEPRIAIGTGAGGLEILDARDGRRLVRLAGHTAGIGDLAFSDAGDRLFSCSADGTVRVWDTR